MQCAFNVTSFNLYLNVTLFFALLLKVAAGLPALVKKAKESLQVEEFVDVA